MGKRFIGIAEETTYGTAVSATDWIDVVSESITSEQGFIEVETAGMRERVKRVPGPYNVGGSFDMIVNADNITKLLKWLLGAAETTDDGSSPTPLAYRHEFTPSQTLKSFTMEICPDVGNQSRQVVGCMVSSIAFEASARELLTASVDVIGQKDSLISPSTPTFSTLRPFIFFEGVVSDGGNPISDVEAFRVTIENDIPDDAYVLGDRFRPDLTKRVQGMTVSGDMDIAFLDWDYFKKFYGSATATEPQTSITPLALKLTFTGESTSSSVEGFDKFLLEIDLPKVYLDTSEANFDRRDRIVQSLGYTAVYDAVAGYICKVTVVNENESP